MTNDPESFRSPTEPAPYVRCALKGSDTSSISHGRVAFHERVDRLSVNETNSTLCPLL